LSCESADPPYSIKLLGACGKRPSRRTTDKRHELAPSHLPATTLIGAAYRKIAGATWRARWFLMSAFGGKADIDQTSSNVCF